MPLTWDLLQQVFTVGTIMTPRGDLYVVWEESDLDDARRYAEKKSFDLIPLIDSHDRIVGVYDRKAGLRISPTNESLVTRDTAISDLVEVFATNPRRGFLVFYGQEIVGLVTPADLNKAPARINFYNLMSELELAIAGLIREHFPERDSALAMLSEHRHIEIHRNNSFLALEGTDVDVTEALYLSDMITIVAKTPQLRGRLGFSSRSNCENEINGLVEFRNDIMHVVRPVVGPRRKMSELAQYVQQARELLAQIEGDKT